MTPSGSRTPLFLHCSWWAREGIQGPPEDNSEFSEYGTATHSVAEQLQLGKVPDMVAIAATHRLNEYDRDQCLIDGQALSDWCNRHVPGTHQTEQAYAFDTATFTARTLMTNGHRDYSTKTPTEYCGTLDLVSIVGDLAIIVDFKTGITPAEMYREQLEFGALCVSLSTRGIKRARCIVLKVSDGQCYPLQWEIDTSDIDEIGLQIQIAFNRIPDTEPMPGRHCYERYCPLAGTCPATVGTVMPMIKAQAPEELSEVTPSDITTDMQITSLAQALKLYHYYRVAAKHTDQLKKGLERFANQTGGIPVAPGKVWAADEGSREYLSMTDKAREYLREALGAKYAQVEANISKTSLKRAAGKQIDVVLERLRGLGATKASSFVQFKERKSDT